MEKHELKRRVASFFKNRLEVSTTEVAKIVGVSERTVQRWNNPDDPSIPDLFQALKIIDHYKLEVGPIVWPERYPGISQIQIRTATTWVREIVRNHTAMLLVNKGMDVVFCTDLFARLYDKRMEDMAGTNMFDLDYAVTEYPWYPIDTDPRHSIVTTLMALADEGRPATQVCFFVSPHGKINRVLMQCSKVDPDHYLFIDMNMGGLLSRGMDIEAGELSHHILSKTYPIRYLEIVNLYMAGYPLSQIANTTGIDRDTVAEYLYNWSMVFEAKDMDELREKIWNFCAEERVIDPYNIVRCNGVALG
jgi:transposase-like protein